jgi:hypothetical protein
LIQPRMAGTGFTRATTPPLAGIIRLEPVQSVCSRVFGRRWVRSVRYRLPQCDSPPAHDPTMQRRGGKCGIPAALAWASAGGAVRDPKVPRTCRAAKDWTRCRRPRSGLFPGGALSRHPRGPGLGHAVPHDGVRYRGGRCRAGDPACPRPCGGAASEWPHREG